MSGCAETLSGFFVLAGHEAWSRGLGVDLEVGESGLSLVRSTDYAQLAALEAGDLPPELVDTDFAVGRCGLIYLLLEDAEGGRALRSYDPRQARAEDFPCLDPTLFADPSAIAWRGEAHSAGTLYIADLRAESRVTALAELGWQLRWTVGAGEDAAGRPLAGDGALDGPLRPLDLAVDRRGFLNVLAPLDGGTSPEPAGSPLAILVLDPGGRRVDVLRSPELTFSAAAGDLSRLRQAALAAAPDGSSWILDPPGRRLLHVLPGDSPEPGVEKFQLDELEGLPAAIEPAGLAIDRAGRIYVGDARGAPVSGEEDTRFIHRFTGDGAYVGPVPGYRGQVKALAVDGQDRILLFSREPRRIVTLVPELTRRRVDGTTPAGVYYSPLFDSTREGTRWHRLRLEREIPEHTQVRVSYLTLEASEDYGDPRSADLAWSEPLAGPRDALVRAAPGRYLAVRLELEGTEASSPAVSRLEARFPRASLAFELPAVYQREAAPDGFLERFGALFGAFFDDLEGEIDGLPRHFDPRAVSGDFLVWLASWLALAVDETWTEERLRTLILRAPELYRMRGTRPGIEELVEIFTGLRPLIFEHFQLRCARNGALRKVLGDLFGNDPYRFCVLLPPRAVEKPCAGRRVRRLNEEERRAVERVVEADAPAHTRAGVRALGEWLILDHHTYLGVNTWLPAPEPRLDSGAVIPLDSVLSDLDEAGQVERRSRIELDTTLS